MTCLQRIWVKSPRRTGYWAAVTSHSMQNINKWWRRGEYMPVAVWIGHHPAAIAGGKSRLGYPESHFPAMGGVMGEPLRLVPSETFGKDLMVPADAEIVIEGYVPEDVFEAEGRFVNRQLLETPSTTDVSAFHGSGFVPVFQRPTLIL
jgi:2,5-furandicarboxylate decarboxylase 1